MNKSIKFHRLILAFIISFIIYTPYATYASGIVGTGSATLPTTSGSNEEYKGSYIDTSSWELVSKSRTESEWIPKTADYNVPDPNDPNNEITIKGVPGHYRYYQVAYEEWELRPSGFYIIEKGEIITKLDEKYIFTKNNVKDNGEPAGLHYNINIRNVRFETSNGETFNAEIFNPKVYHKVVRFQNQGTYYADAVQSTISINGNSALLSGKLEYPYAGNDESMFGCSFTARCQYTYETADVNSPGNYLTYEREIDLSANPEYILPVNSFNAVNYTGSNERQTDLIFKRSPSGNQMTHTF